MLIVPICQTDPGSAMKDAKILNQITFSSPGPVLPVVGTFI